MTPSEKGSIKKRKVLLLSFLSVVGIVFMGYLGLGVGTPSLESEEDLLVAMMDKTMSLGDPQYVPSEKSKTALERNGFRCIIEGSGVEQEWPKAELDVSKAPWGFRARWKTVTQPQCGEGGEVRVIYWFGIRIVTHPREWVT